MGVREMRRFRRFSALPGHEGGNILAITAAVMPLLIGSAALAIDTVQLSLWKRQLQRSADTAALAGAYALAQLKDHGSSVTEALELNNEVPLTAAPVIQSPPTAGPNSAYINNPRAVRVVLESQRAVPFMGFFLSTPPTLRVEATAALVYSGKYCAVSLDNSDATGITFIGNATVNLGCGVIANSRGRNAVVADGSAKVTASPVAAVGGTPASSAYVQPTLLLPYSLSQPDPFANLPLPPANACSGNNQKISVGPQSTQSISPGCYKGMDIKGTLHLSPGTYYIDGSSFRTGAQANVTGNNVTIILTSSTPNDPASFATVSMNGGSTVNLTASNSGAYEGVLFFQDPRAGTNTTFEDAENGKGNQVNGNSSSKLQGAVYMPRQHVTFNGTTGMNTNCLQVVARRISFSGNATINNSCPSDSGARSFDATWVRLVA
jgi:hypothetical protein